MSAVKGIERSHGRVYATTPRPEELVPGVPAALPEHGGPMMAVERDAGGRVVAGESAKALGTRGGHGKAKRREFRMRFVRLLKRKWPKDTASNLAAFPKDENVELFVVEGERWMTATCEHVRLLHGGGELGPPVHTAIETAALELTASRFVWDLAMTARHAWDIRRPGEAGNPKGSQERVMGPRTDLLLVAQKLADASVRNLGWAYELARLDALAREKMGSTTDPIAAAQRAFQARLAAESDDGGESMVGASVREPTEDGE